MNVLTDVLTGRVLLAFVASCAIVAGFGWLMQLLAPRDENPNGAGFFGRLVTATATVALCAGLSIWLIVNVWNWAVK